MNGSVRRAVIIVLKGLAALVGLPIEFVEEPCPDACELLAPGAPPLPCPIALDESLATLDDDAVARALASPHLARASSPRGAPCSWLKHESNVTHPIAHGPDFPAEMRAAPRKRTAAHGGQAKGRALWHGS